VRGTIRAIRGAVQVDADEPELIIDGTQELLATILTGNGLSPDDVLWLLFTATPDLRSAFPAEAARRLGMTATPLMCASEIPVDGALPRVVRLLAQVSFAGPPPAARHVYLRGAAVLRPDIALVDSQ
jgi:chorismate mutase